MEEQLLASTDSVTSEMLDKVDNNLDESRRLIKETPDDVVSNYSLNSRRISNGSTEERMKSLLTQLGRRRRTSSGERIHNKPIKISFNNLNYVVQMPEKDGVPAHKRHVLRECSGYIAPGHATYIMGSSGAGKTSLLNVLSDRIGVKRGDTLTGEVVLNDKYRVN